MSKRAVQSKLSMPDSARGQIKGFTARAAKTTYGATVRAHMKSLGYADRPIVVRDSRALDAIDAHAGDMADSIVETYNTMLGDQIAKLPDGLSEAEYRTLLQPFLDSVSAYNQKYLIPFTRNWSIQTATNDFYDRNGIDSDWILVNTQDGTQGKDCTTADLGDDCDDAKDADIMSADEAADYDFPAHRKCPHLKQPINVDRSTLPAESDLYTGE